MDSATFTTLDEAVVAPPLDALIALFMALGIGQCASWLGSRMAGTALPRPLRTAMGFIVVSAAFATVVHALALLGWMPIWLLRALGVVLGILGVYALRCGPRLVEALRSHWRQLDGVVARVGMVSGALVAVALLLVALGPPTNADSLDYHLGVPLDWLGHGGAVSRHDWITARLAGIGESLNLLGLAAGSDAFGAVLQWAGMLVAAAALRGLAPDPRGRLLAGLLVFAVPAMAFLAPAQKPQLLPAAGLTAALVAVMLVPQRRGVLSAALLCVAFAVGCKHSFLMSGGLVALAVLWAAWRHGRLTYALGTGTLVFVLVPGQVYLRNFWFYGDPLSPLLEPMLPNPEPGLVAYAEYLRTYSGELTVSRLLRLPLDLAATVRPASFSRVLGVGVLAFLVAIPTRDTRSRTLLLLALGAFLVVLLLGQLSPRFFLEPYLWAGAAAVSAACSWRKRLLGYLLTAQAVLCLAAAAVGAAQMFPGAWTAELRDDVMRRTAYGYADAQWMDGVLPEQSTYVASRFRSRAVAPRPFVVVSGIITKSMSDSQRLAHLQAVVETRGVDAVVLGHPRDKSPLAPLAECAGRPYGEPVRLRKATRNPFNRGKEYGRQAFELDLSVSECPLNDVPE